MLLSLLLACADPPAASADDTDPVEPAETDVATSPDIPIGAFQVTLVAPRDGSAGHTSVVGKVYDGAYPENLIWEEATAEGECRLLTPRVPFCATPCGGSAACVEDDTCVPYPTAQALGVVTARGLQTTEGATSFDLIEVSKVYQVPGAIDLPYPAFAEGAPITLSASGSAFTAAFEVTAPGIAPLDLHDEERILEQGRPLELTWTPPGDATLARVSVKLDVSHHGGTRGMIRCDAEDDGALTLPASLVGGLLDLGVAGFPTVILSRAAEGEGAIAAGRVGLVVSSTVEVAVDIPGLVSCTLDEHCPEGQSCQTDLTCR